MTDNHIHIGQFEEVYYPAVEVFEAVFSSGLVDRLVFSSTTSCIDSVKYSKVETEIDSALAFYGQEKTVPLFWFTPGYIDQGVNIETAMSSLPYHGFKLHPFAQRWNFENKEHYSSIRTIFDYAAQCALPVLIHTGESERDNSARFEPFFSAYPAVRFILAHCRPLDTAIAVIRKYSNAYGDTAFVSAENIKRLSDAGLGSKLLLGTDFPITHYFKVKRLGKDAPGEFTLGEQYREDIKHWNISCVVKATYPSRYNLVNKSPSQRHPGRAAAQSVVPL